MKDEEIQLYFEGAQLGSQIIAQPYFDADSVIKVLPKVAKEAIEAIFLEKTPKITAEQAKEVSERLFTKFSNSAEKVIPTDAEIDSLNYAIGVNVAAARKDYYFRNDSTKTQVKAFLKGLDGELGSKASRWAKQGEQFGISLKLASKGAGVLGDSTVMADKDLLIQGLVNALEGADKIFVELDPNQYLREVSQKNYIAKASVTYKAEKEAGEKFLAENATNPNVKTTASGLQYEVITEGKGKIATETDSVTVHYTGKLIDGTVFDSSVERGKPATFVVTQVIKGWTEALQLMPAGSKWTLYIPQELAYGVQGSQNQMTGEYSIPPFSTLVFDVEVIAVKANKLPVNE
ncbi:MAG: FKBP-type peptidyl-prolyl cis-trans isomerase [Prevotellaceae bacterium]|nr:FKBP-type peptidyl-prolyl cis-trans isomerase [Prevotellaceae bacterium]